MSEFCNLPVSLPDWPFRLQKQPLLIVQHHATYALLRREDAYEAICQEIFLELIYFRSGHAVLSAMTGLQIAPDLVNSDGSTKIPNGEQRPKDRSHAAIFSYRDVSLFTSCQIILFLLLLFLVLCSGSEACWHNPDVRVSESLSGKGSNGSPRFRTLRHSTVDSRECERQKACVLGWQSL